MFSKRGAGLYFVFPDGGAGLGRPLPETTHTVDWVCLSYRTLPPIPSVPKVLAETPVRGTLRPCPAGCAQDPSQAGPSWDTLKDQRVQTLAVGSVACECREIGRLFLGIAGRESGAGRWRKAQMR